MTQEVEESVTEQPATHKRQAQKWIIVVIGCIVAALFVSVAVKLAKKPSTKKDARSAPVSATVTGVASSQDAFDEQLQREEKRRQMEQKNAQQEDPIAKLERLRDEQVSRAGQPRKSEKDKSSIARREGASSQSASGEDPEAGWERRELVRALESRHSKLLVHLSESRSAAARSGAGISGSAATGPSSTRARAAGVGRLNQEQRSVQEQLARVKQVRDSLERGEITPEQAAQQFASNASRDAVELPGAAETVPPASRAGKTVGRPASAKKTGPSPGDVHIPLGTVGRAVLDQDVISDYPGPWRGLVIDDIYDVSNQNIVIPKGTRIVGQSVRMTNVNEPINARMGLLINWFVLPDGSKISMDKSTALDAAGVAAIKDQVNRHLVAQVLGVAAYAVLASESSYQGTGALNDKSFEGDLDASLRDQFAPLAAKYLNLVPTITLRSGTPIRIFIEDDIYARPWEQVNAELVRHAAR